MRMSRLSMIALIVTAPVVAGSGIDCGCLNWCYDFAIGAEALYWKPFNHQMRYAALHKSVTNEITDEKSCDLSPDYIWGFRLFGTVADQCQRNAVALEWAHVKGTSSVTTTPGGLQLVILPQEVQVDKVFARQRTRYNKVSLKAIHRFCGNECASLYGYIGGRWAQMCIKQASWAVASTTSQSSYMHKSFSGGGIEAGVSTQVNMWCGFGIHSRFGILGIVGERKYWVMEMGGLAMIGGNLNDSAHFTRTACIGGFEVRLGIDYTRAWSCWWVRAEIGYETNYYIDAFLTRQPATLPTSDRIRYTKASNFGMGGLYLGMTVGF